MEKPSLNNPEEFPDNDVLTRLWGPAMEAWVAFIQHLEQSEPPIETEWRYYNDGKSWLFKVVQKKKTLCWVSAYPGYFKTTFYFPDCAEDLICASDVDPAYVNQFVHGQHYGKTRGLTIEIREPSDLENTKKLMEIRRQVK